MSVLSVGTVLVALGALASQTPAQCNVHWGDSFPNSGSQLNAEVLALASGATAGGAPVLYAGGAFDTTTPAVGNHVAMWNGSAWSALGSGTSGDVQALLPYDDDGAGPNLPLLYAGGLFASAGGATVNRIAVWNGSTWSSLAGGMSGAAVYALALFDDDGAGPNPPAVYAAGSFTMAGGVAVKHIARWDGTSWSSLGGGTNFQIYSLAVFDDDGAGPNAPALFAGGAFTQADGNAANHLAKWDGSTWSPLGSGVNGNVRALKAFDDDGAGPIPPALYAGGLFTSAGGNAASKIARWDGLTWSEPGGGITNGDVYALTEFDDDGAGIHPAQLCASGTFKNAGAVSAKRIAKWDGASWSSCGSGLTGVFEPDSSAMCLAVHDADGAGPELPALYAGGDIENAGGVSGVDEVARWDGALWSVLGTKPAGVDGRPYALAGFDADGAGANPPRLIAAGAFDLAGLTIANGIAAWNGSSWAALGDGGGARSLLAFDADAGGPSAPALYAGASGVRKWNGSVWSAVGAGFEMDFHIPGAVHALAAFDADGVGPNPPALYAAGEFMQSRGNLLANLARWNGSAWVDVGGGVGLSVQAAAVFALTVFDEDGIGSGAPALFVGGEFPAVQSGTIPAANIARWNGTSWTTLGSGLNASVRAFAVFDDDGSGPHPPAIYAGGEFTTAGGPPANHIAKWDGASWSALGIGLDGDVLSLSVFDDDGAGPHAPALYAGGEFANAGGVSASRIAKWDGSTWSALDEGVSGGKLPAVNAMAVVDLDGAGPSPSTLFVGGAFELAGTESSQNIASWIGCGSTFTSFCSGDGSLSTPCPCVPPNTVPNPPAAPGHGCANSLDASGALLTVGGSIVPDSVKITVAVAPNYGAFAFVLKGNANAANGIASSDGIRCVDGQLIRFGGHFAGTNGDAQGQWSYPNSVQLLPVSTATAQPPSTTAYYQLFYRNAAPNFCTSATTNYSNGCIVQWL